MLMAFDMELTKSISGNLTKIKVSVDFFYVSDAPNWKFMVRLCTYISERTWGALIGAGALNRATTAY